MFSKLTVVFVFSALLFAPSVFTKPAPASPSGLARRAGSNGVARRANHKHLDATDGAAKLNGNYKLTKAKTHSLHRRQDGLFDSDGSEVPTADNSVEPDNVTTTTDGATENTADNSQFDEDDEDNTEGETADIDTTTEEVQSDIADSSTDLTTQTKKMSTQFADEIPEGNDDVENAVDEGVLEEPEDSTDILEVEGATDEAEAEAESLDVLEA